MNKVAMLKLSRITKRPLKTYAASQNVNYDVIVIGGGHAGTEACTASARMGAKTLLVTHKTSTIGEMSCNPSFGGIGKGHLMREVDALDGVCARICDTSGIQYKVLNRSKGPAVWGIRAQIDRELYKQHLQDELFHHTRNLHFLEGSVDDLMLDNERTNDNLKTARCIGVIMENGMRINAKTVVITTGTFLNAQINIGMDVKPAGRMGDTASIGLAQTLQRIGLRLGRLKTGTPPRLKKSTIDFSQCEQQFGDMPPVPFSFMSESVWIKPEDQLVCYLTETSPAIERIVRNNLHVNRHVQEEITGPRYCPSIESKVLKFSGRNHHIWLEPEGLTSELIYPNGLSCTLPEALQVDLVHAIRGLEKAEIVRPGYGVEYEFVDPRELQPTLQVKRIENLFLAGQINGTTGYEEAAAQGIIAGVNAAAKVFQKDPLTISRTEGYIGVLIDDLTTLGTNEPYRMFTSRAEFRLMLRPDNADLRLTKKGFQIGCVSQERYERTIDVEEKLFEGEDLLKKCRKTTSVWWSLLQMPCRVNHEQKTAFEMLQTGKENISLAKLIAIEPMLKGLAGDGRVMERLAIDAHYACAIRALEAEVEEVRKDEALMIPNDINYNDEALNLSFEDREKLFAVQPATIGAASRIPGVTPSAVIYLLRFIKKC